MKTQRITRVSRIHALVTINPCTEFHSNPSHISVCGDRETNTVIPKATQLAWLNLSTVILACVHVRHQYTSAPSLHRHSHPLHAVIGRLCGGEKVSRVWTSLSVSVFSLVTKLFLALFLFTSSATLRSSYNRDCLEVCAVIPIFKRSNNLYIGLLFGTDLNTFALGWVWTTCFFAHNLTLRLCAVA